MTDATRYRPPGKSWFASALARALLATTRPVPTGYSPIEERVPRHIVRKGGRAIRKYLARRANEANRRRRWLHRRARAQTWPAWQADVQRLTNWQRNQWARAGYPRDRVGDFLLLQRRAK